MDYRNTSTDASRKGPSQTKQPIFYDMPAPKGRWLSSRGSGKGQTAEAQDPDSGTDSNEVGNDPEF